MAELIVTEAALPPVPVFLHEDQATTTSRDVAEFFGKRHDDVLKRLRTIDCSDGFRLRNFAESSYINAQEKEQPLVRMTRDGFIFLAMGFTGPRAAQFKEAFIAAFNEMEAKLRGDPAVTADTIKRLEHQVDTLSGHLMDFMKRYVVLLEGHQKPPPRRKPYASITPEIVQRAFELFAQGLSTTDVSMHLDISRTSAHNIKHGNYGGGDEQQH